MSAPVLLVLSSPLTVDERHARAIGTSLADTIQVPVQKLATTNLEAFLDDLGGILVHAILCTEAEDVVNGATTVGGRAMLADVLNAPVAELAVSNNVDAGQDLIDARTLLQFSMDREYEIGSAYLVLLQTILEDVLYNEAAGLAQCDLVPHATQGFVDVAHNLRWRITPTKFEQLLPDMASVAVDNGLWDATE